MKRTPEQEARNARVIALLRGTVPLVDATFRARERTGQLIATSVKDGRLRVERVVYNGRGVSTVTPLSEWLTIPDAVAFLDAYNPNQE